MIVFAILAVLMLSGAIAVITLRQPVHAALALVGTLLTLAVAYVQLQAHFLAAIQVIVYAGAIMVLFLFVIMLLNIQGQRDTPGRLRALRPLAWIGGLAVAGGIVASVLADPRPLPEAEIIAASLGGGTAGAIGDALFGGFLLPFHLVGVLLLTGIVGAVGLVQRSPTAAADEQTRAGMPGRVPGSPPPSDLPGRAVDRPREPEPVGAGGGR